MLDEYKPVIEGGHVHVAEDRGNILGFIVLLPEADALLLDNVAVASQYQGMGIGRKLLEFAEQKGKLAGHRCITLCTNIHMTENIDLYRRLGYIETHRASGEGFDRVYMEKAL